MKTLQHTLKLAMMVIVFIFASCSKDDSPSEDNTAIDEPTNHELLMTGKWYIQSTSTDGTYNTCERQSYFHFIDEDTLILESFTEDEELNCSSNEFHMYTYIMQNDTEFIIPTEQGIIFTIETINDNQLVLDIGDDNSSLIFVLAK